MTAQQQAKLNINDNLNAVLYSPDFIKVLEALKQQGFDNIANRLETIEEQAASIQG